MSMGAVMYGIPVLRERDRFPLAQAAKRQQQHQRPGTLERNFPLVAFPPQRNSFHQKVSLPF